MRLATLGLFIGFIGIIGGCATQPIPNGPSPDLAGGDMADSAPDLAEPPDMAYPSPDLSPSIGPDLAPIHLDPPPPPPTAACGTSFSATGSIVGSVSTIGAQEALLGASASGDSLLILRADVGWCMSNLTRITIADAVTSGTTNYASQDITATLENQGFLVLEESMTLTADGRTVIGATNDAAGNAKLIVSTRSAVGTSDFGVSTIGPFAAINASLVGVTNVQWPVISADGLAFYYHVTSSNSLPVGTYEALRASTSDPFNVGTYMPAAVQQWSGVSAISSDRLTLFVTQSFGTSVMTRASIADDFAVPATQQAPGSAYRIVPIDNCQKLVGTCEPGGCLNENICLWNATP